VRSIDVKQDIKPWEQLLKMYPGLVEPIQESWNDPLSIRKIYMITPTKTRAEQMADLTRLAQTLYLVKITILFSFDLMNHFRFQIFFGLLLKMKLNQLDVFVIYFNHSIYHLFI